MQVCINRYIDKDKDYWDGLAAEIEAYCVKHCIIHTNFFYHE